MRQCKKLICLTLALSFLLTGCGSDVQVADIKPLNENENRMERLSMLEEPSIEYEVNKMYPSIIVSLSGYETTCNKIAVLEGNTFPASFHLIDCETDKIVYIGEIETRECKDDTEVLSAIADFSSYDETGRYYIKADMLGRSKEFFISEIDRKGKVINVLKTIHSYRSESGMSRLLLEGSDSLSVDADGGYTTDKDGGKDLIVNCLTVMDMLLAYELHPDVFTDDFGLSESGNKISDLVDELKYEASWLMKMQNPETGGVYTGVYIPEGKSQFVVGGETTKATAYFCAAMARLSLDLNRVDADFSRDCLQAATMAYNCLLANKEIVTAEQLYRAAVEMYRVTGQANYNGVVNGFLATNSKMDYDSRALLDAALSYMSTPRQVNVTFCTTLMQQFMTRTEEKSNAALASRFYVNEGTDASKLLRDATELIVADNIISNQEYENIETNYLQYLSGRNHECIDYTKMLDNPNQYAQLLVLVTELADKKH